MVFRAYMGTTQEIYRVCAIRESNVLVRFDKLREPRHSHSVISYTPWLHEAACYAVNVARELGHTPLMTGCALPDSYRPKSHLPEGETLPVDELWIPRKDADLRRCDPLLLFKSEQFPEDFFRRTDLDEVPLDAI